MKITRNKVLLSFVAGILCLGQSALASATDVSFSLEWLISGRHVGFFVALDKGYYSDEGLNVTISRGYGSGDTVKRVATGSADFGIADTATLLSAHANNNAPVMMVATFFNNDPEAVLTLKSSGIKKLSDLEGKRIAGGSTSASLKLLPALAAKNGLKDYQTVPMAADQIYPALLTKQVDAITGFTDNAPLMMPQAKKENDDVVVLPYSDYGIVNYGSAIITQTKMVKNNDPTIAKFLRASFKGINWALEHPEDAVKILKKHVPIVDEAVALPIWQVDEKLIDTEETRKYGLGSIRDDRMVATYDTIKKYLKLEKSVDLSTVYTTAFLPKPPILPKQ